MTPSQQSKLVEEPVMTDNPTEALASQDAPDEAWRPDSDPISRLYAVADAADPLKLVTVQAGDLRALVAEHRSAIVSRAPAAQLSEAVVESLARLVAERRAIELLGLDHGIGGFDSYDERGKESAREEIRAILAAMPALIEAPRTDASDTANAVLSVTRKRKLPLGYSDMADLAQSTAAALRTDSDGGKRG